MNETQEIFGLQTRMTIIFCVMLSTCMVAQSGMAGNAANQDAVEIIPLPHPVSFESDMDKARPFDKTLRICLSIADGNDREASLSWLSGKLSKWFPASVPTSLLADGDAKVIPGGVEAYSVDADESGVFISANTLKGVRLALYTIRQIVIANRGTLKTEGYLIPWVRIEDHPALGFRALHLCWFPETTAMQMERLIRLAAFLKYNYVIVEPWGTYESTRYPWWGWATEKVMSKRETRRLVEIGADLGVTLIPQINVFGHATLSGPGSLKHAVLDLGAEYEPLFEPGGWNWCLSNHETQKVLRGLIAELYEDFNRPPFFHIGCDEAQPPSCPECRKRPYGEIVCEHILSIVEYVRMLGARTMMWHDMMLREDDPRWRGFYAFGSESTVGLLDRLPNDVVICDWQYKRPSDLDVKMWPTLEYFLGKGKTVAACSWKNFDSVAEQGRYVIEHNGFGFVQTTWGWLNGKNWTDTLSAGATVAWGVPLGKTTAPHGGLPLFNTRFANLMRMAERDAGVRGYIDTGTYNYQVCPSTNWKGN